MTTLNSTDVHTNSCTTLRVTPTSWKSWWSIPTFSSLSFHWVSIHLEVIIFIPRQLSLLRIFDKSSCPTAFGNPGSSMWIALAKCGHLARPKTPTDSKAQCPSIYKNADVSLVHHIYSCSTCFCLCYSFHQFDHHAHQPWGILLVAWMLWSLDALVLALQHHL